MNITDPSLWPPDFGPLRFQQLEEEPNDAGVLLLTADGSVVAELAPLCEDHGSLAFDRTPDCTVALAGCWSLDLIAEDERLVETHVLCPLASANDESGCLTRELAAWASLIVLWTAASRARQHG